MRKNKFLNRGMIQWFLFSFFIYFANCEKINGFKCIFRERNEFEVAEREVFLYFGLESPMSCNLSPSVVLDVVDRCMMALSGEYLDAEMELLYIQGVKNDDQPVEVTVAFDSAEVKSLSEPEHFSALIERCENTSEGKNDRIMAARLMLVESVRQNLMDMNLDSRTLLSLDLGNVLEYALESLSKMPEYREIVKEYAFLHDLIGELHDMLDRLLESDCKIVLNVSELERKAGNINFFDDSMVINSP